MTNMTNLA